MVQHYYISKKGDRKVYIYNIPLKQSSINCRVKKNTHKTYIKPLVIYKILGFYLKV